MNNDIFSKSTFTIYVDDPELTYSHIEKKFGGKYARSGGFLEKINSSARALVEFYNQLQEFEQGKRKEFEVKNLPVFLTRQEYEQAQKMDIPTRYQFYFDKFREFFTSYPTFETQLMKIEDFHQKTWNTYLEKKRGTPEGKKEEQKYREHIAGAGIYAGLGGVFGGIASLLARALPERLERPIQKFVSRETLPSVALATAHPLAQTLYGLMGTATGFRAVETPIRALGEVLGLGRLGAQIGALPGRALTRIPATAKVGRTLLPTGAYMGQVVGREAIPTAVAVGTATGDIEEALKWGGIATAIGGLTGLPRLKMLTTSYDVKISNIENTINSILEAQNLFKSISQQTTKKPKKAPAPPPVPEKPPAEVPTPSEIPPPVLTPEAVAKELPQTPITKIIQEAIEETKLLSKEREITKTPQPIKEIEDTQNPVSKTIEPSQIITQEKVFEKLAENINIPKEEVKALWEEPIERPELPPPPTTKVPVDIDSFIKNNKTQIIEALNDFSKKTQFNDIIVFDISEGKLSISTAKSRRPEKPTFLFRISPEPGRVIEKELTIEDFIDFTAKTGWDVLTPQEITTLTEIFKKWEQDVSRYITTAKEKKLLALEEIERIARGRPPKTGELRTAKETYKDLAIKEFVNLTNSIVSSTSLSQIKAILDKAYKLPVAMREYVYEGKGRRLTAFTIQDYVNNTRNNILKPFYKRIEEATKVKNLDFSKFKNEFIKDLHESYFNLLDTFPEKNIIELTEKNEGIIKRLSQIPLEEGEIDIELGLFKLPSLSVISKNLKNLFSKGSRWYNEAIEISNSIPVEHIDLVEVAEAELKFTPTVKNTYLKSIQARIESLINNKVKNPTLSAYLRQAGLEWKDAYTSFHITNLTYNKIVENYESILKEIEMKLPAKYQEIVGKALNTYATPEQFIASPEYARIPQTYRDEALGLFKTYRSFTGMLAKLGALPEERIIPNYYHHTLAYDLVNFYKTDITYKKTDGTEVKIRVDSPEQAYAFIKNLTPEQLADIEQVIIQPSTINLSFLKRRVSRRQLHAVVGKLTNILKNYSEQLSEILTKEDIRNLHAQFARQLGTPLLWIMENRRKFISSFARRTGIVEKTPELMEWNAIRNMRKLLYNDLKNVFLNNWYKNEAVPFYNSVSKIPLIGKKFADQVALQWIDRLMGWEIVEPYTHGWWAQYRTLSKIPRFARTINALMGLGFNVKGAFVNALQVWLNTYPIVGRNTIIRSYKYFTDYLINPESVPKDIAELIASWGWNEKGYIPIKGWGEKLTGTALYLFSAPEPVNRTVSSIAFYLHAKEKLGMTNPLEIRKYVVDMIGKTQFYYSPSDLPMGVRSEFTKWLYMFRFWFMKELELLYQTYKKEGAKAYLRHASILGLSGGVRGIPLATLFGYLVYSQYKKYTGDDNPLREVEFLDALRKYPILGGGLPAEIFDIDISNSIKPAFDFQYTLETITNQPDIAKAMDNIIAMVGGMPYATLRQVAEATRITAQKFKTIHQVPATEIIKNILEEVITRMGVAPHNLYDALAILKNQIHFANIDRQTKKKGYTFISENPFIDALRRFAFGRTYREAIEREKQFATYQKIASGRIEVSETVNYVLRGETPVEIGNRLLDTLLKISERKDITDAEKILLLQGVVRGTKNGLKAMNYPEAFNFIKRIPRVYKPPAYMLQWDYIKSLIEQEFEREKEMERKQ